MGAPGGGHVGAQYGHPGGAQGNVPPEGYVCHRCGAPGHFKKWCPTNSDPDYDEVNKSGITANNKWIIATLNPEKFKEDMNKTMKSLVKNVGAALYT